MLAVRGSHSLAAGSQRQHAGHVHLAFKKPAEEWVTTTVAYEVFLLV